MSYGMHDYLVEKTLQNYGMRKEAGIGSVLKAAGKLFPRIVGNYKVNRDISNSAALKNLGRQGVAPERILNRVHSQPGLFDMTRGAQSAAAKSGKLAPLAQEVNDSLKSRRDFINNFPNAAYMLRSAPGVVKNTADFVRRHPVGTGVSAASGYGVKELMDED